jgi:excisionase family DNA binding protein
MRHQTHALQSHGSGSDGTNDQNSRFKPSEAQFSDPSNFPVYAQPAFEQVLSSEEAAALLNIHPKTLQRLARKGEIPGFRIGKLWGFRASLLNQWLNRRMAG